MNPSSTPAAAPRPLDRGHTLFFLLLFGAVAIPNGYRVLMYVGVLLGLYAIVKRPDCLRLRGVRGFAGLLVASSVYWWWQKRTAAPLQINSFRIYIPLSTLWLLAYFRAYPLHSLRPVRIGALVASVPAFAEAVRQYFVLHMRAEGGDFFFLHFGAVTAMFALMLLALGLYDRRHGRPVLAGLEWAGALLFALCSLLSGARGAWLCVLLLPLFFVTGQIRWRLQQAVLALLAVGVLGAAVLVFNPLQIASRIDLATSEVHAYQAQKVASTSVGARLEMWRFASRLFREKPLLGWGLNGYVHERDAAIAQHTLDPAIEPYNHPHNQLLNEAAKSGLVGVGFFLLLHFLPVAWLVRQWRRARSDAARTAAFCGLLVPLCFFVAGLTESILLWNNAPIAVYLCAITAFLLWREPGSDEADLAQRGTSAAPTGATSH